MIDFGASSPDLRRRKFPATPKALSLDQESRAFLEERGAGGVPPLDAFYGQFLDSLPPVSLMDLLRPNRAA